MRNRTRLFSALIAAAALLATQAQATQAQVNMTGTWALEVNVDGAISNPELVLEQSGMSLTGHYTSAQIGEADVVGTVDGNTVIVTFEANVGGQVAPVEYRGTVDASGVWSGDFDLAGLAGGPFTGTKASE
jgi:hypothetical protein